MRSTTISRVTGRGRSVAAVGLATAALVLSACSGPAVEDEPDTDAPLNMLVSVGSSGDTFIALAERFSEETGIEVNVEAIPNTDVRQQQILEISTGSSALDVITVNDAWLASMYSNLEDLNAYIDEESWNDEHIIPAMKELFAFDEGQFALPSRVGGRVLVYREDLLAAAGFDGPPKTWDEFSEYAEALTDPAQNQYGAGFTLGQNAHLVDAWGGFLLSSGGSFVTPDGDLAIDSPTSIEATQRLADLYLDGFVPPDAIEYADSELISSLQQGRVAMALIYSPWLGKIADPALSPFADQFRIAPRLPGADDDGGKSWINGWGFGINKSSENKEAAWEFVKYATDPAVQQWLALEYGNDPVDIAVYEDEDYLAAKPEAPNVLSTISDAGRLPAIDGWADVYLGLESVISSIVVGDTTAADALPKAAANLRALLK